MKKSKIKSIIILIIILLIVAVTIFASIKLMNFIDNFINSFDDSVIHSDNISEYNSGDYKRNISWSPVFLDTIPENAQVIDYEYYDWYRENIDVYLELKFETQEELENYLDTLIQNAEEKSMKNKGIERELFLTKQNPYDYKYTDLICTAYASYSGALGNHVDFSIEYENGKTLLDIYHHIISYSVEELTVIQNLCHWSDYMYSYTPKYITRFNIPTNENYEYIIPLD